MVWLGVIAVAAPVAAEEVGGRDQDAPRPGVEATGGAGRAGEVTGIRYRATITGVERGELRDLLEASSQLIALESRPPATLARLRLRVEEDLTRLETALGSEGYYETEVTYRIDEQADPLAVTIEVEAGPRYRLASYTLVYQGEEPPQRPGLAALGIETGMPARAPAVVAAQETWVRLMTRRGYPLAEVVDRKAVINRETDTMSVTLTVDPGPRATFGAVTVEGLERVEARHVLALVPWREGETYDSRRLEDLRRRLADAELFASVAVKPASEVEDDGSLPITVSLLEGPHRSIGFGASYSTDIGFGGEVFWEHRNLFGQGEQLRLSVTAAEIEQSAEARFRKPAFLGRDRALLADVTVNNAETDAFDERSVIGFVGMEFLLGERWRATAGLAPEYNELDDEEGERQFYLLGLPLTAARDATDDRLDPTRGTRLDLAVTPYYGTGDDELTFISAMAGGSAYYSLDAKRRFVLAGRARLGVLAGESTEVVPANKRFYAGGGGSIRGFEFQSVGPLDDDDDPLGGRSLAEVNAELRIRVTEAIGFVPFVDGGTVFDSAYPDFDETFRWAAGIGLRYFTGIGPLRADFAFPLNGRDRDDVFQFYISLGQAF